MNISVPSNLKREMDGVKDDVNWSGIAAEAFRRKILELKSTEKGTTMDAVIARMKAADELDASQDYADGKQAGQTWASEEATPKQLRRLEREHNDEMFSGEPDTFGWAGAVYRLLDGDFDDRDELNTFWESALNEPERIEEVRFAEGFVDGALQVWDAVKGKL